MAPASQGNPGDGVTLGTVELWYFGHHGGRCKRRLCPRAGGGESRKKERKKQWYTWTMFLHIFVMFFHYLSLKIGFYISNDFSSIVWDHAYTWTMLK